MKELSVSMEQSEKVYGWCYFSIELFMLPSLLHSANILLGNPLTSVWINVLYFTINFCSIGFIFRRYLHKSFRILQENPGKVVVFAAILLPVYFAGCWLCSQLTYLLRPDFANLNDKTIAGMLEDSYWLMCIGTVLLVPMAEEVLFRGLIFQGLYNKNKILAFAVSTLAFAAVHVISYIGKYDAPLLFLSLLQYVPAGICLGFAYAKTDTIWTSIIMHTVINLIGVFIVV